MLFAWAQTDVQGLVPTLRRPGLAVMFFEHDQTDPTANMQERLDVLEQKLDAILDRLDSQERGKP